jgi:anti-sigma B factor antagonist
VAPVELTVQHPDCETVQVILGGALDLGCAYDFDEAMRRVEIDAPGRVVLDLRGLELLDTTGLSRLVALRRRCRRAGRRLVLVPGPKAVQRLLALVSVEEQFELVRDPASLSRTPSGTHPEPRARADARSG